MATSTDCPAFTKPSDTDLLNMADRTQILQAIYTAVDETNAILPPDRQLDRSESEQIIGENAKIDSLGLVSLMVNVEREVDLLTGSAPSLVAELSEWDWSVDTLGGLATLISERE